MWPPKGGPQSLMMADSRQVGATALRDLGQDAWLPLPYGQQYSYFSLVEANHYRQDSFSRYRASSLLPFDWLLSATLGALSLRRARDPFRAPCTSSHLSQVIRAGRGSLAPSNKRWSVSLFWGWGRVRALHYRSVGLGLGLSALLRAATGLAALAALATLARRHRPCRPRRLAALEPRRRARRPPPNANPHSPGT